MRWHSLLTTVIKPLTCFTTCCFVGFIFKHAFKFKFKSNFAQVATLVEADYLFLMTDVDALYTANPKV